MTAARFAAIQLAIALPHFLLVRRLGGRGAAALLQVLILFFGQIIGVGGWLALAGELEPTRLLYAHGLISCLILFAALRIDRCTAREDADSALLRPHMALALPLAALFLTLAVIVALKGLAFGPTSTDGKWYHLPIAFLLEQEHGLPPADHAIIGNYPKNFELWLHWLLAGLASEELLDIGQLAFLPLFFAAAALLAQGLGADRGARACAAMITMFAPTVISQLCTEHNDYAVAALLLASIASGRRWRAQKSTLDACCFGIASGLLLGTKGSALFYLPILLLFLCSAYIVKAERRARARDACIIFGALLAFGGWYYIRNAVLFGNPVYPFRYAIGPLALQGPLDPQTTLWPLVETQGMNPVMRIISSWSHVGQTSYGAPLGGFGVLWPFLLLCIAGSLILALREKNALPQLQLYGTALLLFLVTPLNFSVRFVLFLLGIGAAAFAHLLSKVERKSVAYTGIASCALLCAFFGTLQSAKSLQYQLGKTGTSHAQTCAAHGDPEDLRPAYAWIESNLPDGAELISTLGSEKVYSIYCLWNSARSNRVRLLQGNVEDLAGPGVYVLSEERVSAPAVYSGAGVGIYRID